MKSGSIISSYIRKIYFCVYVYAHRWLHLYVLVRVHVCGGQKLTLAVSFDLPPPCVLRQGLSCTQLTDLASQAASLLSSLW